MKALAALLSAMVLGAVTLPASAAPDGAALFARCAACHTKTGAGVPGAYPPLAADFRTLATKPAGRRYIALAVIRGLAGPITVEGKAYRGVMPAQALDDAGTAAVLNHVGTLIAKTGPAFRPFTPGEIATHRAAGSAMTAGEVAKLHAAAGGK